jgi:tetratricopeptide (TPR) repeat protein
VILWQLFSAFFKIGLFTIGGGYAMLALIQQEIVSRGWMTPQEFVYEALENYLGVVENYQQVLMRQPDHDLALNNLAYHYLLREVHMGRAIEMAERAVELDRKAIYLDTLGYGYYLVGRLEEAKELLLEALEGAPEEAVEEISGHLDLVLQALGDENGNE